MLSLKILLSLNLICLNLWVGRRGGEREFLGWIRAPHPRRRHRTAVMCPSRGRHGFGGYDAACRAPSMIIVIIRGGWPRVRA